MGGARVAALRACFFLGMARGALGSCLSCKTLCVSVRGDSCSVRSKGAPTPCPFKYIDYCDHNEFDVFEPIGVPMREQCRDECAAVPPPAAPDLPDLGRAAVAPAGLPTVAVAANERCAEAGVCGAFESCMATRDGTRLTCELALRELAKSMVGVVVIREDEVGGCIAACELGTAPQAERHGEPNDARSSTCRAVGGATAVAVLAVSALV